MQQLLSFFSFLTPLILEQVGLFFDILGIYNNLFTLKCRIKRDGIASSPISRLSRFMGAPHLLHINSSPSCTYPAAPHRAQASYATTALLSRFVIARLLTSAS